MTAEELFLLTTLLERAQPTFTPVEVAWVNTWLAKERERLMLEEQLRAAQANAEGEG